MAPLLKSFLLSSLIYLISASTYSQNGWIWQNPLPQGNSMSNLQFVNSTTAYALCFNSVMKSTNTGSNWSIYYTMQDENNVSMHFINENTGFIICDSGKVLKTLNGGLNWNVIYDFEQIRFHRIYFSDANTGFSIRYLKNTSSIGTALYRTTNAGIQWSLMLSDSVVTFRNFAFLNSNSGFMVGSGKPLNTNYARVFRTTNAGFTWDSLVTSFYCGLNGIIINDANNLMVHGRGSINAVSVYVTTNFGANWIASDLTRGVVASQKTASTNILVATESSRLYKSTNNGLNWLIINNDFPGMQFKFINEQTGLAIGNNGAIQKTTNGGINWSPNYIQLAGWIWSVDFVNENTGFASNGLNGILKTTNAGLNWMLITGRTADHIDFIDANTGFCSDDATTLYKSTNGGVNWIQQNVGFMGQLNEIQFVDHNTGYVLGKNNLLSKTTNGGMNWSQVTGHGNAYQESMFFVNGNTGFVGRLQDYGGGDPVIARTTNGGVTWDSTRIPNHYYPFDLYFTNANTGYVTLDNPPAIFKTTNSGINWFSVYETNYLTSYASIWSIQFVNDNTGYATYGNRILKTTNAGNSWSIHNSIANQGFYDLYFTDVNTGYFVGTNGVILKTTNGCGDPIGIEPISSSIPESFELFQNYPNPFNPVTTIRFTIPNNTDGRNELTTLKIFDILGKEISVPVSEILSPGEYEVSWDASGYPSGVYFCVLSSGNRSASLKIMLVK